MNIKRLKKLQNLLLNAAKYKPVDIFYLGSWYEDSYDYTCPKDNMLTGHTCGTSACALGLACLDRQFQDEGLKLTPDTEHPWLGPSPEFEGKKAFEAGAAFFDISLRNSQCLFDPDQYEGSSEWDITPKMVADRIQELIDEHQA